MTVTVRAQEQNEPGGSEHSRISQARLKDELEIRRLIAAHAAASQRGDLQGLVGVYHDDADVRYSDGTILRGKTALAKDYREALSSDPHAIAHSHPARTIHIRFLRPDVAFVDVESVSGGGVDQTGKKEPLTRTPLLVVFTKENGKWGVAVQRSRVPLK
jgi:uncharacterized protein (TIGR02246 family)